MEGVKSWRGHEIRENLDLRDYEKEDEKSGGEREGSRFGMFAVNQAGPLFFLN